jgi:hypothetical protein
MLTHILIVIQLMTSLTLNSIRVGLIIGAMLTSVLMNVIGSAVDTIIVCFAEAPQEFHINHPELHSNMVNAWRSAWPTQFSY